MNINRDPDAIVGAWLDDGPAELPLETRQAIVVGIRTIPRHRRAISWPFGSDLPRPGLKLRKLSVAVAVITALAVIGAIAIANLRPQLFAPAATLPTSPSDWTRVVLDQDGGSIDKVVATPRGLFAQLEEGGDTSRFYFSTDGRTWTRVPAASTPNFDGPRSRTASLAGNDERILIVGSEVSFSEDGLNWSYLVGPTEDPELGQGAITNVAIGGPGFVAVGSDNKAWYSTDGTDWALAAVPPRPDVPVSLEQPLAQSETQGTVEMQGVASSRGNHLAWGMAVYVHVDQSATFVPVFWTSRDGMSWTSAPAPGGAVWDNPMVAGGPNGFLVTGESGAVWFSADGSSWEQVAPADAFGPSRWLIPGQSQAVNDDGEAVELTRAAIAAGPAGYVVTGADGQCASACSSEEAVIWTSTDGRSWTRVSSDAIFQRISIEGLAGAEPVAAWGDRFVVGGQVDGQPAIWISSSAPLIDNNQSPAPTEQPVAPSPSVEPTAAGSKPPIAPQSPFEPREDGEFLAFESLRVGRGWNLGARNPETSVLRTIVATDGLVDCGGPEECANFIRKAEWSADGRWVAFEVANAGLDGQPTGPCAPTVGLWVKDLNGALRQLTTPCDAPPRSPDEPVRELWEWSPVAAEIAYVRIDGDSDELLLINPSNGTRTSLAFANIDAPYPVESDSVAWSPDGSRIAYADAPSVHVVDVDSGDRSLLADSFDDIIDIAWSPAGTQLFVHDQGRDRIQVMNADGSDLHVVLDGEDACCETAWSSNGDRIVYMISINGAEDLWYSEVWTVAPDGSNRIQVFDAEGCGMPYTDTLPVWAPNGTQVAYLSCDGWVVQNADGTGEAQPIGSLDWRSWYGSGLTGSDLAGIGETSQ